MQVIEQWNEVYARQHNEASDRSTKLYRSRPSSQRLTLGTFQALMHCVTLSSPKVLFNLLKIGKQINKRYP